MRDRAAGLLLAVLLVLAGCGGDEQTGPAAIRFTEVVLPPGAAPIVLTPVGDTLLVGVRREGAPVVPGLLRLGRDGSLAEIAVRPAGMYGQQALWYSIAADGRRIVALGGRTGGAHGNVRWSVWTGSDAGLTERLQPFSTFGGYGAGDLVDAVLPPGGPALVGSWQNPSVGLDIMVWQPDGEYWVRRPSAGTALENKRESLKFPLAAAGLGEGILIAGWELSTGRQRPAVWRSSSGASDWTMTRLPDAGRAGVALAVRCTGSACTATGWVDGELAMWHLRGDSWTGVRNVPDVEVAPEAALTAPTDVEGHPTTVLSKDGQVVLAGSSLRPTDGPTGEVRAVARLGETLYVAAGNKLWRTDLRE